MPNLTAYLLEGNGTDVEERKRLLCSIESCFFYALALIAVFLMWGFYQKTFKILTLEILWFIPSIVAYNKGFHLIILPWAAFTLSYLIYFHFVQRQTFKLANIMLWNKIQELCVFSGVLVFVVCLLYMNFLGSVEYIGQEGSLMGSIRKFGHKEGPIDWAIVIAILPFYLSILIKYAVEFMYRHMVKKTTFPDESGLLIHPDTCGICLATTLGSCGNETKLFICDHEFHKACIDLWVNLGNLKYCPRCQKNKCRDSRKMRRIFGTSKRLEYMLFLFALALAWLPLYATVYYGVFLKFLSPECGKYHY